ncbi:peptidoglycan/xylan/chitin deacetylase (PgdA/CDA1 family) [Kitasatospora sp. MAP12-15]|uniref:polysaccharide deacetylase family protein n=1 Tax=unclassified Kitasatospora TaxID=2633591 RepID=UPI0024755961|nr:polysaccharide deacetylase family protein [Kitasatospora sp. MAP12-44]MDH6115236.1 peptidoglycan/xylan/chitin deacetylase (PgdA/CDA1 family) [Kitasatospora sp. MAP12-44]
MDDSAADPEYYVHAGSMALALTIDDGPSADYTPQVLSILRQYGVTATFFMVGSNVDQYPDVARQVHDEGHLIGNHTWSHVDLGTLSADQTRDEIQRTSDIIAQVTDGTSPTLFRAPGGYFTHAAMAVCGDLGLAPISWSVDPEDWSNPGTSAIVDRVLSNATTGSIILNHDGLGDRSQTVSALQTYLPQLIDSGYQFVLPDPAR